jgi:hypothetical protein
MSNKSNKSFLALITPFGSLPYPDQGLPTPPTGQPPHPDNTLPGDLPRPAHPIWLPLPPGAPVDPDYGIDVDSPYPDQGLPGSQPKPDQGLPGPQPHPEHPIVLPPDSGGWLPVYIWGPNDPRPGTGLPGSQPHPDQGLPPIPPPTDEEKAKVEWKTMWTPSTGWVSFAVVVPAGGTPVPTPSKK